MCVGWKADTNPLETGIRKADGYPKPLTRKADGYPKTVNTKADGKLIEFGEGPGAKRRCFWS